MSGVLPSDWFLTIQETRQQPPHTSGNEVSTLIDGQSYMQKLLNILQSIGPGGYIHISGWRLTPSVKLLGDVPNSPSIQEVLTDRSNVGVTIRSLLWMVPFTVNDFAAGHGAENLEMSQILDGLGEEVVLDDRLPNIFSSHHQKFIIAGQGSQHVAYIGGMDIAPDRWDSSDHNEPVGRQRELFDGWHDVQAQVDGPAVGQLWNCFFERWNDPRKPNNSPFTVGNRTPSAISAADRPVPVGNGTCHVQVLCTYPCRTRSHDNGDDTFYPFAPDGDRSYESALVKAVNAAEHYVYIEDQYFWPCAVVDALTNAVRRGVSVILLLTNNYDVAGLVPYHNFLRHTSIEKLRNAGTNVFVYTLKQDGFGGDDIYIHSKTMIIDDRYAVIGTANMNRRSMSTDTEIAIAVVDGDVEDSTMKGGTLQVNRFAKNYRMQLWEEHLGVSNDDPLNSDGSPRGWPTSAGSSVHNAHIHTVPEPRFCQPAIIPFIFMNPDTICL
jgi:phosphatidylserine/phosphatidylglycerophosphate/cardiolipin synthase-like enzyme